MKMRLKNIPDFRADLFSFVNVGTTPQRIDYRGFAI